MRSKSVLSYVFLLIMLVSVSINCTAAPAGDSHNKTGQVSPVISSFAATESEIASGAVTTLTWATSSADTVKIDPGIGSVNVNGTIAVTPQTTTAYTLVASNKYGSVSRSLTVNVKIPEVKTTSPAGNTTPGIVTSSNLKYPVVCLDGTCRFINNDIYCIEYPDTWKIDASDLNRVKLTQKEGWTEITIVMSQSLGSTPVSKIANDYVALQRDTHDKSFYLWENEAMSGAWDWHIDWNYLVGASNLHTQVFLKNTDQRLYTVYINYDDVYYNTFGTKKDVTSILSSFSSPYQVSK